MESFLEHTSTLNKHPARKPYKECQGVDLTECYRGTWNEKMKASKKLLSQLKTPKKKALCQIHLIALVITPSNTHWVLFHSQIMHMVTENQHTQKTIIVTNILDKI